MSVGPSGREIQTFKGGGTKRINAREGQSDIRHKRLYSLVKTISSYTIVVTASPRDSAVVSRIVVHIDLSIIIIILLHLPLLLCLSPCPLLSAEELCLFILTYAFTPLRNKNHASLVISSPDVQ